jgi:FkbM family methyltransferase
LVASADEKAQRKLARRRLRKDESAALREYLGAFLSCRAGRSLSADPLVLIDVGARGGLPKEWEPASPLLRAIGFEPDPRPAAGIRKVPDDRMEIVRKAVAATVGMRPFYCMQSGSASSLLEPEAATIRRHRALDRISVVEVMTLETTTIDEVARERQLAFVDAIKLDTQGSELEILMGARETLAQLAFCIFTEVEFVRIYENQPLFRDIDAFVQSEGFELISLTSLHALPQRVDRFDELGLASSVGQLVSADALYFRSPGEVMARLERRDETARVRYLAGAVVVCLIYHQADYAAHLVEIATPMLRTEVVEDLYRCIAGYQRKLGTQEPRNPGT